MSLQRVVLILVGLAVLIGAGLFGFRYMSGNRARAEVVAVATERPTSTPTATATPTVPQGPPSPVPQTLVPTPAIPAGAQAFTFTIDPKMSGWSFDDTSKPNFGDSNVHAGVYKGQNYLSVLYFDLRALPPGSKILYADVDLTGLNRDYIGANGTWALQMLKQDTLNGWTDHVGQDFANAVSIADIGKLSPKNLSADQVNQFVLNDQQRGFVEQILNTSGIVPLRLSGPKNTADDLFTWYGSSAGTTAPIQGQQPGQPVSARGPVATPTSTPTGSSPDPVLHIIAIPGKFTVVPFVGTPENIVTQAARAWTATAFASRYGTPTPYPRSVATATPLIVVTPQPTPANSATAIYQVQLATAVAFTTGTYTPTPSNWVTSTPEPPTLTPIPTDKPTATATPTAFAIATLTPYFTATPGASPLEQLQTPVPSFITGNIIFLSNHFGQSNNGAKLPVLMTPNGQLTAQQPSGIGQYNLALAREPFSPDRTRRAVVAPDSNGILQIWVADANSVPQYQITHLFTSTSFIPEAYDPVWSPDGGRIAYVSTQTHVAEIYVYDLGTKKSTKLTDMQGNVLLYNQHPSWSPDGSSIVFKSNRDGWFQIWIMNADGSNQRNLSQSTYDDEDPVWVK